MRSGRDGAPLEAALGTDGSSAALARHRAPAAEDGIGIESKEVLIGSRGGQVLTAGLGAVTGTDAAAVATESHLSPQHDLGVVGPDIVAVQAVVADDAIATVVVLVDAGGAVGLVAATVALVQLEEGIADGVCALVADPIASLG